MSQYYFSILGASRIPEGDGIEFTGIADARSQALGMADQIPREHGTDFWDRTQWYLTVTDDTGRCVFKLRFTAEDHGGA